MSAALSRYANAGQPIGHAGPDAPIHADERIALADLPRLTDSPQAAAEGYRAWLIQRDREQRERANQLLREHLAAVLKIASRNAITPADDAAIARATRAPKLGGLL